jgi:hypothetical protein
VKLVSRRSARRMPSESVASSRSWNETVEDVIVVAGGEVGLLNATGHETEAVATEAGEGAGAEPGHASAQSPSSQRISRWMTTWLYNSYYRKASR